MASNYLITGYRGEPHVTAEEDRHINAAIFGGGKFVLSIGEQFFAEHIGNNTIRLYDGVLLDNGAAAAIPYGQFLDFSISAASPGKERIDLLVFQYRKDQSTLVETGEFFVLKGTEGTNAVAPSWVEDFLLSTDATRDQMPLWEIHVNGSNVTSVVQRFTTVDSINGLVDMVIDTAHPVGSVYITFGEESPAEKFGGTWEKLVNHFLLGAGGKYAVGSYGGHETETLTVNQIPSHSHGLPAIGAFVQTANNTGVCGLDLYGEAVSSESTGGGASHNNMPPYFAVYMWKRVS